MYNNVERHKTLMDDLYSTEKYPDAVTSWASFFAKKKDEIGYSNWRHLNKKRQDIENDVWKKFISKGFKILEVGCGEGFFLKRLYSNFGDSIDYNGIDISSEAIDRAKKFFKNAKYFCSAAEKLPFKNESFDYVQIISTLEHVIDVRSTLKEAYRILKKNGYLYIVIHKNSVDPLLISTIYFKLKSLLRKKRKIDTQRYTKPLGSVRCKMFKAIEELGLRKIENRGLIPNMSIAFYRKLHIKLKLLIWIGDIINKIPISIFKNLEYFIYKK